MCVGMHCPGPMCTQHPLLSSAPVTLTTKGPHKREKKRQRTLLQHMGTKNEIGIHSTSASTVCLTGKWGTGDMRVQTASIGYCSRSFSGIWTSGRMSKSKLECSEQKLNYHVHCWSAQVKISSFCQFAIPYLRCLEVLHVASLLNCWEVVLQSTAPTCNEKKVCVIYNLHCNKQHEAHEAAWRDPTLKTFIYLLDCSTILTTFSLCSVRILFSKAQENDTPTCWKHKIMTATAPTSHVALWNDQMQVAVTRQERAKSDFIHAQT